MKKNTIILSFMFLTMLIMGSVYSYSVYRPFIETEFKVTSTLSGLPYMFSLFFYALSMYGFGKIMRGKNLKSLSLLGIFLLVFGFGLSALAPNIFIFTLGYGLFMGVSVGILYGLILFYIQNHFDHHTGIISGVLLFGFGLSSVFVAPLSNWILTIYSIRVLFLGFMVMSLLVSLPIYVSLKETSDALKKVVKDKVFKEWRLFFLTTLVGLTMIGLTASVGIDLYRFNASQMALIVSLFAFLNAISRIIFGFLMDKIGFEKSAYMSMCLIIVGTLINILNQGQSLFLFALGYGLYWFNLGAWLSMMPTQIKTSYGKESYGPLYGKVFTAYGVSALIGTLFSGIILDSLSSTEWIYVGIFVVMLLAFIEVKSFKNVS